MAFSAFQDFFAYVACYKSAPYCGHVWGNSSRTLSCDVYKLTMQSMIDNLGTKSEAASARLRRKEITFLLFRGRVKGACMCAASVRRRKTCVTTHNCTIAEMGVTYKHFRTIQCTSTFTSSTSSAESVSLGGNSPSPRAPRGLHGSGRSAGRVSGQAPISCLTAAAAGAKLIGVPRRSGLREPSSRRGG